MIWLAPLMLAQQIFHNGQSAPDAVSAASQQSPTCGNCRLAACPFVKGAEFDCWAGFALYVGGGVALCAAGLGALSG